jgi:catechol 2,3-dioxygenase
VAVASATSARQAIHAETQIGAVRLNVSDLDGARAFYERVLGLHSRELDDGVVGVGATGRDVLVELHGNPRAPALNRRATGLYHLAILVPDRYQLALSLARLAQARWPLDGASNHLVSEALYLSDPDGNGIEIYRDRPREQWRHRDGVLEMATLALDLEDVIGELGDATQVPERIDPRTRIGHVHLQVAELDSCERFYSGVLGLDVTVRGYSGALFLAAGGYHHHIGLNTWHSAGASPPAPGAIGLRSFDVLLPEDRDRAALLERARAAGIEVEQSSAGPLLRDPSGNGVVLAVREEPAALP